jgi:hypothetical protein
VVGDRVEHQVLQRQFTRDLEDEVARALFGGLRGDPLRAFTEFGAQPLDGARREPREMILRNRVCSGSSIMIIDAAPASIWPPPPVTL